MCIIKHCTIIKKQTLKFLKIYTCDRGNDRRQITRVNRGMNTSGNTTTKMKPNINTALTKVKNRI